MEILETISFVGSLFIVVYLFILQPNQIKGASMFPTFREGEFIFTSKVTYRFRDMKRGDVVVFHSPEIEEIEFIKRIIGLPGDRVKITSGGDVVVNGHILVEDYISSRTEALNDFMQPDVEVVVPQGKIFVLGDNRSNSSDSRKFGPIRIESIVGQVFYRYFPFDKVGPIKNDLRLSLSEGRLIFV